MPATVKEQNFPYALLAEEMAFDTEAGQIEVLEREMAGFKVL